MVRHLTITLVQKYADESVLKKCKIAQHCKVMGEKLIASSALRAGSLSC